MTKTFYSRPTSEAIARFTDWLRERLAKPENAERHAKAAIDEHDWSRSLYVEIRGFYTATGNPVDYKFDEDEMIAETAE